MLRPFRLLLIIMVFATVVVSCKHHKESTGYDASFVRVGTKKLRVYTSGEGENTIVLESGLGDNHSVWFESGIFDAIKKNGQVIAYDRAGTGESTENGETRGIQALVNDLHKVILEKSSNRKVILVGHSLGGAVARAYAVLHPNKVKALLLIDPNNENFKPYATMSQGHEDTLVQELKNAKITGGALEAEQLIENISFLKKLPSLPDIPVVVITSVKTDSEMTPENVKDWSASHQALEKGITQFTHVETGKSGHAIHQEEPDLVIENIRKLMNY